MNELKEDYFDKCIYTILHSEKIKGISYNGGIEKFREYKNWKRGLSFLDEAKSKNKKLILLLSSAEDTRKITAWATISEISISPDKSFTDIEIQSLTFFEKRILKTSIQKENGEKVLSTYIRPYLPCLTPFSILIEGKNASRAKEDTLDSIFTVEIQGGEINSIENLLFQANEKMKKISLTRRQEIMEKTIRSDSKIVQLLKHKYNYKCQFPGCESEIKMKNGNYYVEVAHIKPVSKGGKSIIGNLLVLCPNHHKEFDFGDLNITNQALNQLRGILNGKEFSISI